MLRAGDDGLEGDARIRILSSVSGVSPALMTPFKTLLSLRLVFGLFDGVPLAKGFEVEAVVDAYMLQLFCQ